MMNGPTNLETLERRRNEAWQVFVAHRDPGNLTPAQKRAYKYENMAYLLLLRAAQMKLNAEQHLQGLLAMEAMQ